MYVALFKVLYALCTESIHFTGGGGKMVRFLIEAADLLTGTL